METAAQKQAMSNNASGQPRGDVDEAAEPAAPPLKCPNVAEEGKGKRIAKVSQEYIDRVLHEKATGTGAYKVSKAMEIAEKYYRGPHDVLALVERGEAIMEQLRAGDNAILEQYHRLGHAYTEVEEDSSFIYDEKIFGPVARSRAPDHRL